MDVLKIILPALVGGVMTWLVMAWLHRQQRAEKEIDRGDAKAAEAAREERARLRELHKQDLEDARRLLDRVFLICSEVSSKPRTGSELAELGTRQVVVGLSQMVHKMPNGAARESFEFLWTKLANIERWPLPDGVRTGKAVHPQSLVDAACLQGREGAHALDYLPNAREDVFDLWAP